MVGGRCHRHAVAALQPGDGDLQLLVVDAVQHQFVRRLVVVEAQGGVLLQQPGEGTGQLDVVLAVGRLDRDREVEGGHGDFGDGRERAGAQPLPGSDGV